MSWGVFRSVRLTSAVLIVAAILTGCRPAAAVPAFPFRWPDYSVIPILFVPTDWAGSAEVREEAVALNGAMEEIQRFYGVQLGGRTFRLNRLQVVEARGPKERYHIIWNGRNIYEDGVDFDGNMEHEVVSELHDRGFPTPVAQNVSGYSVVIFVKGAGGWAGGREFPDADGGWAILGDWAIDSIHGDVPEGQYWWSGRRIQTGAVAHELGHTFDLPHPDSVGQPFDSTIMGTFWNYPQAGLNDSDRTHILAAKAPFFPEPGPEPAPRAEPLCLGRRATIVGTDGPDRLEGTAGRDVIVAFGGDDEIFGRGGDDLICAGAGDDYVDAGRGNDTLFGGPGKDSLLGGEGRDHVAGDVGDDTVNGGTGADEDTDRGNDTVVGGDGNDTVLDTGRGADRLYGGAGNDTLSAGRGDDRLFGGPGDDELSGGPGTDRCTGNAGNNIVDGSCERRR